MYMMRPGRQVFGFQVEPDDEVPGFRVGVADRNLQVFSDSAGALPPGTSDLSGATPVDCTVAQGNLSCRSSGGTSFHPAVPAPLGFPDRIGPDDRRYHEYDVRSGATRAPQERLLQGLIDRPTPGPEFLNHPATPEGTLNEATPWTPYGAYLGATRLRAGAPFNPVRSYLRHDDNGNPVVVNVTEPGHSLFPGYVVHSIVPTADGPEIRTEGEGLGRWQAPDSPQWLRDELSRQTWRPYQDRIIDQSR
ncbi:hypothetical protein [Reyranella sp.]|uniref:hypothetical protein n=1 Tax=Reyranella sp. TaxID=1929291 RepID=UPI003BA91637